MSATYHSLKPPETQFDDDYSDDNSIQGSPLLDTAPIFSADNTINDSQSNFELPASSYHEDEEYEDELYGTPSRTKFSNPYQAIENESPYTPRQPAKLSPILEPSVENDVKEDSFQAADDSNNSFHTETLNSGDLSPTEKLRFTRERPKSELITSSFSIPSEGNIISEPTNPSSFIRRQNTRAFQRKLSTRNDSAQKDNNNNNNNNNEDDEDTLPFEDTTRMAMQGRPHSMVILGSVADTGRVMTKESFESYRRSVALDRDDSTASTQLHPRRSRSLSPVRRDVRNVSNIMEEYEEDDNDDEKEQKKKAARLRQEQDARMSIYRQSMMRLIGETPVSNSSGGESLNSVRAVNTDSKVSVDHDLEEESDLMDDIPLSILQAHRFPKNTNVKPSPLKKPQSVVFSSNRNSIEGSISVKSAPPLRSSPEPSPFNRPVSIASSRMLPNVVSPGPGRQHARGLSSHQNPVHKSYSTVFGNKDKELSRGLIGEISREEDARRKRHTIGYGFDSTVAPSSPKKSPSTHSLRSTNDPEALQGKLDLVIEMLAKLAPQDGSVNSAYNPLMGPTIHPVNKAPTIASFSTFDHHSSIPSATSAGHKSPSFGMGEFQKNMGIPFPPPPMDNFGTSSPIFPNFPGAPPPPRNNFEHTLNRPSQVRLVNPSTVNDDDDDDAQLQKLKEEREKLKTKWMEKAKNEVTRTASVSSSSNTSAQPSSTTDSSE